MDIHAHDLHTNCQKTKRLLTLGCIKVCLYVKDCRVLVFICHVNQHNFYSKKGLILNGEVTLESFIAIAAQHMV